jgi:hypothetical protein
MLGFHSLSATAISALKRRRSTAVVDNGLLGGGPGYSYHTPHVKHQEERRRAETLRLEKQRIDTELARREQVMLDTNKAEATLKMEQEQLHILEQEISALRMERMRLIRLLDDEEAIFVILMSLPTIH